MALVLESGLQDAMATSIITYVDAGTAPELVFETTADVEVATIILNATTSFTGPSAGVITMAGQPLSDTDADGGVTDRFSIYQNVNQTNKVLQGTVDTAGEDITISSTTVGATDTVQLTTFTITVPAS